MTTGVKDQLSDQKINNKKATRSDTTLWFFEPPKTIDLTQVINQVVTWSNLTNLGYHNTKDHIMQSSGKINNTRYDHPGNQTGKTWGGFDLAILKVNLNPLS